MPRANNAARPKVAANNRAANAKANRPAAANSKGAAPSVAAGTVAGTSAARPTAYSYGTGTRARHYTANGYGHGYRNRSSGRGYGRSQGNNRALVSRLRSVHSTLARLDHDYRGHRVNAMRSISSAIRSLSHRASSRNSVGNMNIGAFGNANRANANNGRNGAAGRNVGNGQGNRMTQAQSDARMTQALRTTQGIHMQMTNQRSTSSSTLAVAHRHVSRAINELHTALTVR